MAGQFEQPIIIGCAKKTHCFSSVNISALHIHWNSSKKAWMMKEIMSELLSKFDNNMRKEKSNLVLFLDNALSHPDNLHCTNNLYCTHISASEYYKCLPAFRSRKPEKSEKFTTDGRC